MCASKLKLTIPPFRPSCLPSCLLLWSRSFSIIGPAFSAWRLLNRPVLLVGGGGVATGRLFYMLEAGAKVTLIAPREGLSEEVLWRIEQEKRPEGGGEIIWHDRLWEDKDEEGLRG